MSQYDDKKGGLVYSETAEGLDKKLSKFKEHYDNNLQFRMRIREMVRKDNPLGLEPDEVSQAFALWDAKNE